MKKLLFIINGMATSGKDSFCDFIKEYSGHETFVISSIDRIMEISKAIGWDGVSKTEKDRKLWSYLKDLCTWYNDSPYTYVKNQIMYFEATPKTEIMFIHIREPKEIEKIKATYPYAKTILVTNKNVPIITSNSADAGVFDYHYDYYIKNDGILEDLKKNALSFIERFYVDEV